MKGVLAIGIAGFGLLVASSLFGPAATVPSAGGCIGPGVGDLAAPFAAGVAVDARGVLSTKVFNDPTGQLGLERRRAAKAALNPKVAAFSKLRKISLNRLEDAVKARIALGQKPTDEMLNLKKRADRHQYAFCIPETKDIVIAGPAEGWAPDLFGRSCGILTGRPIVPLEDLIVALRAFPPNGKPTPLMAARLIRRRGLAREQDFSRRIRVRPPADELMVDGLRTAWDWKRWPSAASRRNPFRPSHRRSRLSDEADRHRVERQPIGLDQNYVDRANLARISRNGLASWYFVPTTSAFAGRVNDTAIDGIGWRGVKLVGADEVGWPSGPTRNPQRTATCASLSWCNGFTKKYPEIAAVSPVFAQFRNLVDISGGRGLHQQEDFLLQGRLVGWTCSATKLGWPCKPRSRSKLRRPSTSSGRDRMFQRRSAAA